MRRAILLLMPLLVLVLAGCTPVAETEGDDGESEAAGAADAPARAASPGDEPWPGQLVLGLAPARDPEVLAGAAEPLRAALSRALELDVETVVPESEAGLADALAAGELDVAALPAVPAAMAVDRHGAAVVAQLTRQGGATFHTQWFTADVAAFCRDDPVPDAAGMLRCNDAGRGTGPAGEEALAGVAGRRVALVAEASASGNLFPRAQLVGAGVDLGDLDPVFAGGHDATVRAVAEGHAEVGVSYDDARRDVVVDIPDVGQRLVVFALTPEVPHDLVVARPGLPASLREALGEALVGYAASDEGGDVLGAIYGADGAVPADLGSLAFVRETIAALSL